MADAVVDASAVAAITFGEDEGPTVAEGLTGVTLHAPSLLWYELANVCLTKLRRYPGEADRLRAALEHAQRLAIRIHHVDPTETIGVAEQTGLSAYDASYLCLARRLHADLVTLDKRLHAAARDLTA